MGNYFYFFKLKYNMRFNIIILILTALLVVDAESSTSLRELRKASRSSYKSSYKAPSYSAPKYYKKTTTYKKTYTASRYSYTGSFVNGRSSHALYVYYLPVAGYY